MQLFILLFVLNLIVNYFRTSSMVSAHPVRSDTVDDLQVTLIKQDHLSGPRKSVFSVTVSAFWNDIPLESHRASTLIYIFINPI